MSTRVKSTNRECRCDVDLICRFVRTLAALTNLGIGVAAGFVVSIGAEFYNQTGASAFCSFVENTRLGIFLGIIGVFYCLFAVLGFLGELRFGILRRTVLAPFGVLLTYVGRGSVYLLLGTIFCALPMSKQDEIITLVPGGVMVAIGFVELLLGLMVKKEKDVVITKTSASTPSSAAAKIKWGEPEGANATSDTSSGSSSSAAEAGNFHSATSFSAGSAAATPTRKSLVAEAPKTPASPASGKKAPANVTTNPFRTATSGKAV
jgi:hypothetical protein